MVKSDKIVDRFLKYIQIDTTSDASSNTVPTTPGQLELVKMLKEELVSIGITSVNIDDNGYLMASLESNTDLEVPVIGFLAHVDTSPDMKGSDIKPKFHQNYQGGEIVLNREKNIVLSPDEFPELLDYKGETIITTDGTTLLGADDKAGIAEIVTAMEYLVNNPEIKHGKIMIAFTPDEEIGRGADHFDVKKFGANYAYTLDGSGRGEIEYETFNAAYAKISIQGRNVHPGYAKNKMINALQLAKEFDALLPMDQRPYNTEGYEGYFHLLKIEGEVEQCNLEYIIRDHDKAEFENRNQLMHEAAEKLNKKYGPNRVQVDLKHQYYNMGEKIEPVKFIVDIAIDAIKEAGIEPKVKPVRGGTDGARLSYMGLPCPNLFAGGHNFHGKFEFIPFQSMKKAADVIVNIAELFGQGAASKYQQS